MARKEVRYSQRKRRALRVREETLTADIVATPPRAIQNDSFALVSPVAVLKPPKRKTNGDRDSAGLRQIEELTFDAERRWKNKFVVANDLTRSLVSFQANKSRAIYRWYKYKEAFSAGLVEHFLNRFHLSSGVLLDPFAGSGTALFAAGGLGIKAEGIELLPIGQTIIETKQMIDWELRPTDIATITHWKLQQPWQQLQQGHPINELRITKGAYPPATAVAIGKYLAACDHENNVIRAILRFALALRA